MPSALTLHTPHTSTSTRWASLVASQRSLVFESLPNVLLVFFFAYPAVTNIAFQAFMCYDFGSKGEDVRYLTADVNVRCGSAEHTQIKQFAWGAVLAYPIGAWPFASSSCSLIADHVSRISRMTGH